MIRILNLNPFQSGIDACLTPQILFAFFSVVTNPRRMDQPLVPTDALRNCEDIWICREIEVLEPQGSIKSLLFSLATEYGITGTHIFDCIVAATAKQYDVVRIYTENTKDFGIFEFLEVVNPLE